MVSCCRRLGVRTLFLTSGHGQVSDVPVNLYQMNFILCSYTNGQSSKAQCSASKAPVLAERRQISAGSSFRARLPHPAPPSSLREPGIQRSWLPVSSSHPNGETRSHRLWAGQTVTAVRPQRQGWGEAHCCPEAWATAGGALQGPGLFPGPLAQPPAEAGWRRALRALDWITSPVVPHRQLPVGGAHCSADQ